MYASGMNRSSRHDAIVTWAVDGNRADAQRAADLAYNQAVTNGPATWRAAYPLRTSVENLTPK
jgi:hypothetical protein